MLFILSYVSNFVTITMRIKNDSINETTSLNIRSINIMETKALNIDKTLYPLKAEKTFPIKDMGQTVQSRIMNPRS